MANARSFLGGDALLFLTALIWGFAFVAQRVGMDFIGPFAFNAVRYLMGALSLLPLLLVSRRLRADRGMKSPVDVGGGPFLRVFAPPLLAGVFMFLGTSFQQVGIVSTTAGNAAFITSLYVVLVPFIGSVFGKRVGGADWAASLVAVAGLWLITMQSGFSMAPGDLLELACAFFWAMHIIVIGRYAGSYDPILLSIGQFTIAGLLSLAVSLATERTTAEGLRGALVPLLYGGLGSCGIAFTLQIFGQRRARASHASIILALEGLFGALGGILILGEPATLRILLGGGLMVLATMLPQLAAFAGALLASRARPG